MENKNTGEPLDSFVSAAALKAAHAELLKRYREDLDFGGFKEDNSQLVQPLVPDIEDFIARGASTGKLIDSDDERAASQAYLDYWMTILFRAGINRDDAGHVDSTLDEFDPDLAPDIPEDRCPYLGLDAFQEQHQNVFFGRNAFVQQMLETLGNERFLAVVGPSGSGKSSAMLAGLVPMLKSGALPESETWNYYAPMVPGSNPLRSLAVALAPAGADSAWVEEQVKMFMTDYSHLCRLLADSSKSPSVLVIDQFEEIFTLCNDEAVMEVFALNLMRAITLEALPHRILITLRIEFQEQMPRLTALYPLFQRGLVHILPLSTVDLRDVIERPAAEVGLKFEQGIVDSLVKEIIGEPAGLPLLQFTLLQLWRQRDHNRVLLDVYNKLGGARETLTNVATAVYERLPIQEQVVAQRVFLRLAWAGQGVEVLRNRVRRRLLHKVGGSHDIVDRVLKKLTAARLIRMTKDEFALVDHDSLDDQFEVAHEALIRNWRLLIGWLQVEHETLRERIRVRSAAEQWRSHGRDRGGLIGGSLLIEAAKFEDLEELEKEFIEASREAEEAALYERKIAHENELKQLELLNIETKRSARRLRYVAVVLAVGIFFISVVATYAYRQRNSAFTEAQRANESAQRAETARGLAEKSKKDAENFLAISINQNNLAREAQERAEHDKKVALEARENLAVVAKKLEMVGQNREIALAEATENLSFAQERQTTLTRDLLAGDNALRKARRTLAAQPSFSADSTKILTFFAGLNAQVWDTRTQQLIADLKTANPPEAATFSPDGRLVITASSKGGITVTNLSSEQVTTRIPNEGSEPLRLEVSADSSKLAVLNGDGTVHLIDLRAGRTIAKFSEAGPFVGMAFSGSGDYLALTGVFGQTTLFGTQNDFRPINLSKSSCVPASIRLANMQPNPNARVELKLMTACGQGEKVEVLHEDPKTRTSITNAFNTMRVLLVGEYAGKDPDFPAVSTRIPQIKTALHELKAKVANAEPAAPASLTTQFTSCKETLDAAMNWTTIDWSLPETKLLALSYLFKDDSARSSLKRVSLKCNEELNNELRDAGIADAGRKFDTLRTVVESEFKRIDMEAAEKRVMSETLSLPVFELIVMTRKDRNSPFEKYSQVLNDDYDANELHQFLSVATRLETDGISTEDLDYINNAILEFFKENPIASIKPGSASYYGLISDIQERLGFPHGGPPTEISAPPSAPRP